jgi:hypothetical protein
LWLPLIHLVPTETPSRLHRLQPFHQSVKVLASAILIGKLLESLAKQDAEGFLLGFCEQLCRFDSMLVGAKGDVIHTETVDTIFL